MLERKSNLPRRRPPRDANAGHPKNAIHQEPTAMTNTTPPKSETGAAPAPDIEPQGESAVAAVAQPGGKASARAARAAQEDRLAAALRANLARRKAATRAARAAAAASGDDDAEA